MRILKAVVIAAGLAGIASPALAECSLSKLMFNFKERTIQHLDVRQGEYCSGALVMPGITWFRIEVAEQPKNGLVSVNQKTFVWKYRPFKNFKGEDKMVFRLYGYNNKVNDNGYMEFKLRVF
jgi:hypothetical protein